MSGSHIRTYAYIYAVPRSKDNWLYEWISVMYWAITTMTTIGYVCKSCMHGCMYVCMCTSGDANHDNIRVRVFAYLRVCVCTCMWWCDIMCRALRTHTIYTYICGKLPCSGHRYLCRVELLLHTPHTFWVGILHAPWDCGYGYGYGSLKRGAQTRIWINRMCVCVSLCLCVSVCVCIYIYIYIYMIIMMLILMILIMVVTTKWVQVRRYHRSHHRGEDLLYVRHGDGFILLCVAGWHHHRHAQQGQRWHWALPRLLGWGDVTGAVWLLPVSVLNACAWYAYFLCSARAVLGLFEEAFAFFVYAYIFICKYIHTYIQSNGNENVKRMVSWACICTCMHVCSNMLKYILSIHLYIWMSNALTRRSRRWPWCLHTYIHT